jgi:putative flippase GtrA
MTENTIIKEDFKTKNKGFWQFIKFTAFSLVTTVVELTTFSLFNYLIFTSLSSTEFKFWLFNYSVANGGMCAFLSFTLSFLIAQIFNFIIQRKVTFHATNHILYSAIMYGIMIFVIFVLQLWIPTLIRVPLSNLVGNDWADMIAKNMMMTLAFIIQFPMNKWVIMKDTKKTEVHHEGL